MTEVDWGGTHGLFVKTRGTIVGGRQVSRKANGFAFVDLFGQYGGTLLAWLLGTILQST